MLSDEAWSRIRSYTHQVLNREADHITFHDGAVFRMPTGDVQIVLMFNPAEPYALEPEEEDIPSKEEYDRLHPRYPTTD